MNDKSKEYLPMNVPALLCGKTKYELTKRQLIIAVLSDIVNVILHRNGQINLNRLAEIVIEHPIGSYEF